MKKPLSLFLALSFSVYAFAQINTNKVNRAVTKNINPAIANNFSRTARFTNFKPAVHGFKFINTFKGVDASSRWGGLCGGMVYAELDYYYAGITIPQQNYPPSNRYPLHSYIYKRQAKSAQESNWDRWAELGFNPGGARNAEFFGWGIEMKSPGDRMSQLKNMIDQGRPAPLGLFHSDEVEKYGYRDGGDHQVLAIGYDFGRYKGDKGAYLEDFKIYVCDPNSPGIIRTLVASAGEQCFHYTEPGISGKKTAWLTYFVNTQYEKVTPVELEPSSSNTTLYMGIGTGKDDLRGENDNLMVTIKYTDGSTQEFPNINRSGRWVSEYYEVVPLVLNRIIQNKNEIRSIVFKCSLSAALMATTGI
jgi:hypothetical protein